jgi:hypothetical protein
MAKATDTTDKGRRDFLKLATAAAPAAMAAAVVGTTAATAQAAPKATGLQDSEHTRTYFATARF